MSPLAIRRPARPRGVHCRLRIARPFGRLRSVRSSRGISPGASSELTSVLQGEPPAKRLIHVSPKTISRSSFFSSCQSVRKTGQPAVMGTYLPPVTQPSLLASWTYRKSRTALARRPYFPARKIHIYSFKLPTWRSMAVWTTAVRTVPVFSASRPRSKPSNTPSPRLHKCFTSSFPRPVQ